MSKFNTVLLLVKLKVGTTVAVKVESLDEEKVALAIPVDTAFVYLPTNIHGYYQELTVIDGKLGETGKILPLPMVADIRASIIISNK